MLSIQLANRCLLALITIAFPWSISGQELPHAQHPLSLEPTGNSPLLALHRALVEIESISGNEFKVGQYLHSYLTAHNFTVERQRVDPLVSSVESSRFNLLAYSGDKNGARVLLSSHIDTVPPYSPYERLKQNQIWGRGSVDAKGCVATQIQAVQELLAAGEIAEKDVALLFVVGEEIGGDGMRKANDRGLSWDTVIFGEPTELKLASGHKGNLGFNIKATGKAGHSGYPWLGENANSMLIPALAALDNMELPSSKKYGNTTLNIGKMEGGVAGNVIAETAKAQIQIRIANGSADKIKEIVVDAINKVDDRLEISFLSEGYGPVDIDTDIEGLNPRFNHLSIHLFNSLPRNYAHLPFRHLGFDTIVVNYGTDIPNLYGTYKKYLYGPGSILVAHSDHEHLTEEDLFAAVKGYKKLILAALA